MVTCKILNCKIIDYLKLIIYNKKMSYDMLILYIILYFMFLLSTLIIIYKLKSYTKADQEEEFLPPYEQPPSYDLEIQ
jgi:hypothetical protein